MPRKQNRYANRSQVNGIQVAVPFASGQSASQIAKDLDLLISERDDIAGEIGNWSKWVQAVARAKGIPFE